MAKNKYLATIVKVDGTIEIHELDKFPDLKQLQSWVGGYIQEIPYWSAYLGRKCRVYADEGGKFYGKPFNPKATQMWKRSISLRSSYISALVGDIVIVTTKPKEK